MSASDALDGRSGSRIGEVLGDRYEILRQLSMGGMGTVYEARHVVVGRHFAVKVLHPECANRPRLVRRFEQEAKAVGALASEHVVAVVDFGEHFGTPYFVMELLQGKDLRELLSTSGALPVPRAMGIALDVCKGLRLAHAAGLTHRDLKPANIFVTQTSEGRELAKVLDFGVAKLLNVSASTGEGTLIGTVGYMAPEQIHSGKAVDSRADIYSLGVVLYEMLAGTPAYPGEKAEVLYRILHDRPVELHQLRKNLPKGLAAIVDRATAKEPEQRYRSVAELATALNTYAYPGAMSVADGARLERDSDDATASRTTLPEGDDAADDDSAHGGSRRVAWPQRRPPLSARGQPLLWLMLAGVLTASGWAWLQRSSRSSASLTNAIPESVLPPRDTLPLTAKAPLDVEVAGVRAPSVPEPGQGGSHHPQEELPAVATPRSDGAAPSRLRRLEPASPAALEMPAPLPVFDSENPYASPSP